MASTRGPRGMRSLQTGMGTWYPLLLFLATVAASAWAFPRLPARVPIHWDVHNQPNGYGSRTFAVVFTPLLLLAMWALLRGLPRIDPRRANYAKMQGAYDLVVNASLTVVAVMHVVALGAALGYRVDVSRVAPAVIGVLFIVIGNVLPRARPNWWFGIRTPWTLSSDRVWARTHRVGGYVFAATGVLMLLAVALPSALPVVIALAIAASLGVVVYSFVVWRRETPP